MSDSKSPEELGLSANDLGNTTKKTPFQEYLEAAAKSDKTTIVGDEIITSGPMLHGETSFQPAKERGWLSAISRANIRGDVTIEQRQRNVQDIVDAAVKAGVGKDKIQAYLQTLGISVVSKDAGIESEVQRILGYVVKVADSVLAGSSDPKALQNYVDYAVRQGVPKDRIETILSSKGIEVQKHQEAVLPKSALVHTEQVAHSNGLNPQEILDLANKAILFVRNHPPVDTPFGRVAYTPMDLKEGRHNIDPQDGRLIDAHGIAKGSVRQQLEALNQFLTKGIDPNRPFHSIRLRDTDEVELQAAAGMGAAGPYDNGSFIILGEPGKSILEGIKAVLVEENFYDAIPTLQNKFPQVRFIRAKDAPAEIKKIVAASKRS